MSPDKQHWNGKFEGLVVAPPPLTKPDSTFHDMGLEFVDTKEGVVLTELNELFEKVNAYFFNQAVHSGSLVT